MVENQDERWRGRKRSSRRGRRLTRGSSRGCLFCMKVEGEKDTRHSFVWE